MNESAIYTINLRDKFSGPLGGLETKMNRFEGKVSGLGSSFESLGGSIASAFAGGLVAGGIAALVSGLKDVAINVVSVTREFTNLKEAIEFASGDRAGENVAFLDAEIKRLGLDMNSAYKGFKTFQGGIMGTNLEGEKGREIFSALSEAATVMKLSADQTEGAFLALGQMVSKGTVSAEELRGQLGERLPGAFQIFARALGVSTSELGDMLKKGEVLAEDALPKFAAELRKTFSPGVAKAQESFNSNLNRFNNFILESKIRLGNGLLPVLNDLVKIIPRLDFSAVTDTFRDLFAPLQDIINLFKEFASDMGINIGLFDIFQALIKSLALTLRAGLTGIMLFYTGFKILVQAVKDSMQVFQGLGDIISGIWDMDSTKIYGGLNRMEQGFKNIFDNAKDSAMDFFNTQKDAYKKIFTTWGTPEDSKKGSSFAAGGKGGSAGAGAVSAGSKSSSAGIEKISAGTRNVTLNIQKLIGEIKYEKWQAGSEAQLQAMVTKAVLSAVNDVNIVPQ